MTKLKTVNLSGKEYATVPTRIKEFREACPYGEITTEPTITENTVMFKVTIVKDRRDENSAKATGHAMSPLKGLKAFEKTETIATGRALSLLGYMASGEVASSEEMEEFEAYKNNMKNELIEKLELCKTQEELKTVWTSLSGTLKSDKDIINLKDKLKAKLK